MISLVRSLTAFALSFVLTILTFGRVELNRTGRSTTDDDSLGSSRPAAEKPLDDGPREVHVPNSKQTANSPRVITTGEDTGSKATVSGRPLP
jgi:hypothetical protein